MASRLQSGERDERGAAGQLDMCLLLYLLSVSLLFDHRVCCLFLRCLTGCLSVSTVIYVCLSECL